MRERKPRRNASHPLIRANPAISHNNKRDHTHTERNLSSTYLRSCEKITEDNNAHAKIHFSAYVAFFNAGSDKNLQSRSNINLNYYYFHRRDLVTLLLEKLIPYIVLLLQFSFKC